MGDEGTASRPKSVNPILTHAPAWGATGPKTHPSARCIIRSEGKRGDAIAGLLIIYQHYEQAGAGVPPLLSRKTGPIICQQYERGGAGTPSFIFAADCTAFSRVGFGPVAPQVGAWGQNRVYRFRPACRPLVPHSFFFPPYPCYGSAVAMSLAVAGVLPGTWMGKRPRRPRPSWPETSPPARRGLRLSKRPYPPFRRWPSAGADTETEEEETGAPAGLVAWTRAAGVPLAVVLPVFATTAANSRLGLAFFFVAS